MSKTVQGFYRNGHVELIEDPADGLTEGPVLVTFLEAGDVDLKRRGISEQQAALLRAALSRFAEDWESPEMHMYDDYDTAKSNLPTR